MKKNTGFVILITLIVSQTVLAQVREDTLVFSENYKESILKLSAIKSNLIFIDSTKLLSTFSIDKGIKEFVQIHNDSNFSFVSTFRFEFINMNLVLKKNKFKLSIYELAFYNYVKNTFLNFKFKERRRTNNKYLIITNWMFDSDEKQIVITIMNFTKNQYVVLFKAIMPFNTFTN